MSKKAKKKISTVSLILIAELAVMLLLLFVITFIVSRRTRQNSLDHMATISEERAHIVESFVLNSEKTLSQFCCGEQVRALLELDDTMDLNTLVGQNISADLQSQAIQQNAEDYTQKFADEISNVEGLWIGSWNTLVLTHTNEDVIGKTTREDPNKLKELQQHLLDADGGIYNAGIIVSPASGKQILSMYKAVFNDNHEPIGLVGLGIYTQGLVSELENLSIRGISNTAYSMLDANNNTYIFNSDDSLIAHEATSPKLLDLCKSLRNETVSSTNYLENTNNGEKIISTYTFMEKYNWILLLDAPKSEVYKLTNSMRIFLGIFGALIFSLFLIFNFISKRQQATTEKLSSQIQKNERTKNSLSTAMFKDLLTDVSNRVSFQMDLSTIKTDPNSTYYFAMFDISGFSEINVQYGNDVGDTILLNVAQTLSKIFIDGQVYRTGSDEFVVIMQTSTGATGYNNMINNINAAHAALMTTVDTPAGPITPQFRITMVKKSSRIDTSVIVALKEMGRRAGNAVFGQVVYNDLDHQ